MGPQTSFAVEVGRDPVWAREPRSLPSGGQACDITEFWIDCERKIVSNRAADTGVQSSAGTAGHVVAPSGAAGADDWVEQGATGRGLGTGGRAIGPVR